MPPPVPPPATSSSPSDLGSDDEWQCTMGSDSDVDDPHPAAKLPVPPAAQPPADHPTLSIEWSGDDVESYVEDVPLDNAPNLASLTLHSRPSVSPPGPAAPDPPLHPAGHASEHRPLTPPPQAAAAAAVAATPTAVATTPISEPNQASLASKPGPCFLFPASQDQDPDQDTAGEDQDADASSQPVLLPGYQGVSSRAAVSESAILTTESSASVPNIAPSPPSPPPATSENPKPTSESPRSIPILRVAGLPNFSTHSEKAAPANVGSSDSDLHNLSESRSELVPNSGADPAISQSGSQGASSSKSGSIRGRAERKVSGLRQSIRNRARIGSIPLSRRNRVRMEQRNDEGASAQGSASRSRSRARSRGPSFNFGRSSAAKSLDKQRPARPQSTPPDGMAITQQGIAAKVELTKATAAPPALPAEHMLGAREDADTVVFEKVAVKQARKCDTGPSERFNPVTKEHSFLECLSEVMKGANVNRKKNMLQVTEARIWLRPDMEAVEYRHLKKGAAPGKVAIVLRRVRKMKATDRDLQLDVEDEKKAVEFTFRTAKELDIWVSALCCLVGKRTSVKKHHKRIENRWDYNAMQDTWSDNLVCESEMVRELIMLGTIGSGMTARVKAALSITEQRFYAVKVIGKGTIWKHGRMGGHLGGGVVNRAGDLTMDCLQEAMVLKDLRHENVIRLYGVFESEELERFYYVTEYLPSGPVMRSHNLQTEKRLSEDRARSAFVDVLAGLEYLHGKNVVHRDIKPDNLLSGGDGTVKISDFGAAIMYRDGAEATGEEEEEKVKEEGEDGEEKEEEKEDEEEEEECRVGNRVRGGGNVDIGTPAFTAPELCISEHAPKRPERCFAADIWSLGATLFYFLYGRPPHVEKTVLNMYDAICTETLLFPSYPVIPVSLQTLLRRMLTKKPEDRAEIGEIIKSPWLMQDALIAEKVSTLRKRVEGKTKRKG